MILISNHAKYLFALLVWALAAVTAPALSRTVTIEAVDSLSGQAVPYVAVYVGGTNQGILADDHGVARVTLSNPRGNTLELSAMGYAKHRLFVEPSVQYVRVPLSPAGVELDEVVVNRRKEHYSKRDNPAVRFMEKIRSTRRANDPRRHDRYSYTKYDRIAFGLNNFDFFEQEEADSLDADGKPRKRGKFDFLREHVDTSEITGRPILPLSVKEKVTDVVYRRSPQAEKTYVRGLRQTGIDDITDLQSMQTLLEDAFREIDLYDDDIAVLQNRFVSPLSRLAPDFYKFYLTDTVEIGGRPHIELSFAPRNPATFGFTGRLYVEESDTAMFVRRVRMNVPPSINLNYIDHLQVIQEFDKAPDGSRLKTLDDFNIEISIIKGTQGMFARRTTAYKEHSFDATSHEELFSRLGSAFSDPLAYARDDAFWEAERQVAVSRNEARIPTLLRRLRGVKAYYYGEKFIRMMAAGYVGTARSRDGRPAVSKFDLGPLNTFISANTVEGLRLRLGGVTTAALSRHWFGRLYGAYGFKDRKFLYGAEVEYSFNEKRNHSREFPVHALRATERYDIDQIGQHYLFTNPDNVFLTLKRMPDRLITYRRETRLDYRLELNNHLSFRLGVNAERQEAGPFVPLRLADGTNLGHYNQMFFDAQVRWAPGEKFYQTKTERIPINLDAPVIVLTHTFAPRRLLGSPFAVNKTELSVQKRFWFSAWGYADVMVKGGVVWGRSPWTNLLIPNANLSYTIQPESYALMEPMEFVNDRFAALDLTYWANGAILNYVPLLKRLRLREVFALRGWWGGLRRDNDPRLCPDSPSLLALPEGALATPMGRTPYLEAAVGLDNLLRCLRVDYVWRLTYRSHQSASSLRGLRIALHLTF